MIVLKNYESSLAQLNQISTKLATKHPWVKVNEICSNE